MNRYTFYIAMSIFCLLFPIGLWLYAEWDAQRPKTGPVGDGSTSVTLIQVLPAIGTFILGVLNLPVAIVRYRKYKARQRKDL
ncbi:hypothetical protein IDH44_23150 [Paenibacillus sp. IB182496]|uniref:Uncharacterized protein n=1 Tax=Paenibacillus sabuli TaxID=2772509 RepID=A0A927BYJ4_9BACL|nr:hypothetical protein [Paenibacillus sabuli]MBD2848105.1 hypothetical protein [Paenibacillus sabuli]